MYLESSLLHVSVPAAGHGKAPDEFPRRNDPSQKSLQSRGDFCFFFPDPVNQKRSSICRSCTWKARWCAFRSRQMSWVPRPLTAVQSDCTPRPLSTSPSVWSTGDWAPAHSDRLLRHLLRVRLRQVRTQSFSRRFSSPILMIRLVVLAH